MLLIPINAVMSLALARTEGRPSDGGFVVFDGLLLLAADWVAFPIVLALIARPLGVTATYVSYVVTRNWAAPLAAAIMALPLVLAGAGWTGDGLTAILSLLALALVLRFHYLILRFALDVAPGPAFGLLSADLMLSLALVGLFG